MNSHTSMHMEEYQRKLKSMQGVHLTMLVLYLDDVMWGIQYGISHDNTFCYIYCWTVYLTVEYLCFSAVSMTSKLAFVNSTKGKITEIYMYFHE